LHNSWAGSPTDYSSDFERYVEKERFKLLEVVEMIQYDIGPIKKLAAPTTRLGGEFDKRLAKPGERGRAKIPAPSIMQRQQTCRNKPLKDRARCYEQVALS
jgi:hypothetical protein